MNLEEITHIEAVKDPSKRQTYVDQLVKHSGKTFPEVSKIAYIPEEQLKKLNSKKNILGFDLINGSNMLVIHNGNYKIRTKSTIYVTPNCFDERSLVFQKNGVSDEEIKLGHEITLVNHEHIHAIHQMQGIAGIPNRDFGISCDFFTDHRLAKLFTLASEIYANVSHIEALAKTDSRTNYFEFLQRACKSELRDYLERLSQFQDDAKLNCIINTLFNEGNRGLSIGSPKYQLLIIP